ncbi:alpha/beta fold hydrolase [Aliidiomarina soli]|uniref:AB hydrolase-1 domain-containing protein n=1 Tax=Aliidiomarina soli TaxID=1928574 RepID=A0A432WBZ5_9GAMM|nr:alpha/beta hydrolase [Aliidiomarina soli]RUO29578.1 hypothetical protein CWE14_14050 [Aliidiomarina soli]
MLKALSVLLAGLVNFQVAASSMLELDGGSIEYEVKEGGDRVVLFDAGALSGMAGWDSIWERLPANITAVRFSRLGEGNSKPCSGQRSAADYVDEVDQLLNALHVERPIVYVGHSLGGTTARNFAAIHQGDVAAMLMVDPENPRDIDIVYQLNPEEGRAEIEMVKQNDYAAGEGRWCFLDMMWDKSPAAGLAEIGDIPVTLIAGVKVPEDPSTAFESAEGRRLWGQIQSEWVNQFPRGEAVVTSQSGHFVQDDEPELVVSELVKLLNNVRP